MALGIGFSNGDDSHLRFDAAEELRSCASSFRHDGQLLIHRTAAFPAGSRSGFLVPLVFPRRQATRYFCCRNEASTPANHRFLLVQPARSPRAALRVRRASVRASAKETPGKGAFAPTEKSHGSLAAAAPQPKPQEIRAIPSSKRKWPQRGRDARFLRGQFLRQ